jgi:site-specific recombinase XerD
MESIIFKDFKMKLELAKQLKPRKQVFKNLDNGIYYKKIKPILNKSTQKEINYLAALEVRYQLKHSKKNIRFYHSPYWVINMAIDSFSSTKKNAIIDDFNLKFISFIDVSKSMNLSESTITFYKSCGKIIRRILFMLDDVEGVSYDVEISLKIIDMIDDWYNKDLLTLVYARAIQRIIKSMIRLNGGVNVLPRYNKSRPKVQINDSHKCDIDNYINTRLMLKEIGKLNATVLKNTLRIFAKFIEDQGCLNWKSINTNYINSYILTLSKYTPNKLCRILSIIRCFTRYLYNEQIINENLSYNIPRYNYISHAHLPSLYTKEEKKNLLNSIDFASTLGKRDYCMILITCRYGLRASDVCGLKFENIIWERDEISIVQKKTKIPNILPLTAEVGNSLLSYLKVRPKVNSPYIFLRLKAPFTELSSSSLHAIITKRLRAANINIEARKHGPHALRHSLSRELMDEEVSIDIISNILGHKSINTTAKYYMSSNLQSLKKCAIEVNAIEIEGENNE